MDEIDFKDVYIESVLGEIKRCVSRKIELKTGKAQDIAGDRVKMVDQKMREILKDVLFHSTMSGIKEGGKLDKFNYNFLIFQDTTDECAKRKLKSCLVLYYTALYFGNVKLLSKFFQNSFDFGDNPSDLYLCLLDSELVNLFEEEEYFSKVMTEKKVFERFYNSIKDVKEKERKKYLDKFAKIVKHHKKVPDDSLIKKRLDIFDEETYLMASETQLENVICKSDGLLSEETIVRLNNLIKNSDYYYGYYTDTEMLFKNFTDEELADIDFSLGGYYARAIKEGADINRIKNLYSLNKMIVSCDVTYDSKFLSVFRDDEIAQMDKKIIEKLHYNDVFFYNNHNLTEADVSQVRKIYDKWLSETKKGKNKSKIKALIGLN